jgi:hypothetical protein
MAHVLRLGAVALLALFVFMQLVPVPHTNPRYDQKLAVEHQVLVPPNVKAILDRSCRDCHSDDTEWPLYARIAPTSWLLANHVREGREQMNLSEWGAMDSDAEKDLLIEVCRQVKKGKMPVWSYTLIHRSAALSQDDVKALCAWSDATRKALRAAE